MCGCRFLSIVAKWLSSSSARLALVPALGTNYLRAEMYHLATWQRLAVAFGFLVEHRDLPGGMDVSALICPSRSVCPTVGSFLPFDLSDGHFSGNAQNPQHLGNR